MTLLILKRSHFGSSWFPVWKGASRVSSTDLNVVASFTSTVRARISHQTHWLSWLALWTVSPRPLSAPRSKSTERKFWLAPSLCSFLKLDVTLGLHCHFKSRPIYIVHRGVFLTPGQFAVLAMIPSEILLKLFWCSAFADGGPCFQERQIVSSREEPKFCALVPMVLPFSQ